MPKKITLTLAAAALLLAAAAGGIWLAGGLTAPPSPVTAGDSAPDSATPAPRALAPVGLQIVSGGAEGPFELKVGQELQLMAAVELEDGSVRHDAPITWTSSDPRTAIVAPSGILRALAAGEAVIQAHLVPLTAQTKARVAR